MNCAVVQYPSQVTVSSEECHAIRRALFCQRVSENALRNQEWKKDSGEVECPLWSLRGTGQGGTAGKEKV